MFRNLEVTGLVLDTPFFTFLCPFCIFIKQMTFFAFIKAVYFLHNQTFHIIEYYNDDRGSQIRRYRKMKRVLNGVRQNLLTKSSTASM